MAIQLLEGGGHRLFEAGEAGAFGLGPGDGLGRADAGDHILALGVDEVFAVEVGLAGGRVAGEGHAGAAVVTHVAEDHGLDVDGGAPVVGDAVQAAIDLGAVRSPSCRRRRRWPPNSCSMGSCGKASPSSICTIVLEDDVEALPVLGGDLGVELLAGLLLGAFDLMPRTGPCATPSTTSDVHHDEAAVGIAGEAGVVAGALARPSTVLSLSPRLRTVSIMPGMETRAPERTESSSGFSTSPSSRPRFAFQPLERIPGL